MTKFKDGDEVFCKRSKEELRDIGSNTHKYCGVDRQMLYACGGDPLTVVDAHGRWNFTTYLLKSDCFKGMWWFHEDDLDFYNTSLENE